VLISISLPSLKGGQGRVFIIPSSTLTTEYRKTKNTGNKADFTDNEKRIAKAKQLQKTLPK
jgi:hypothetical protein